MTLQQCFAAAVQHFQMGDLRLAEQLVRQVLGVAPQHVDGLHLLGLIAQRAGALVDAATLLRGAIALAPGSSDLWNNLGLILRDGGRLREAVEAFLQARELAPENAVIYNNLASVLMDAGENEGARYAGECAVAFQPQYAEAWSNLGNARRNLERHADAEAAYREALRLNPRLAVAHNNLGTSLQAMGQMQEAAAEFQRAVELEPRYAMALNNLGNIRREQDQPVEAEALLRRAIAADPNSALAWSNLGTVLLDEHRLTDAAEAYGRAAECAPNLAMVKNNLATVALSRGDAEGAIAQYREALGRQPESSTIHSNLCAALQYSARATLASVWEEHRAFDQQICAGLLAGGAAHANSRDPNRRLRLGFVSPHFARHPVGRFGIGLFEHLDPGEFELICYSLRGNSDAMTERFRARASVWRDVRGLSDEALAEQVRADGVDILFDLAGHTAGNRLLVFARKPAPIQISWLDYVGTTGVAAMDYLIADGREIPPGAEQWYTEKVLRMEHDYICFDPPGDAPEVNELPALGTGAVTFGSFNIPAKMTPETVELWSRVLGRVPGSRMVLKNRGIDEAGTKARLLGLFAKHGIGMERVTFSGWAPPGELLGAYHRVDIGLDTWPYNGGLTTCESLWMGVPVVTCAGETFASRHGLAHLTAAGVPETIANSLDEYVERAVALATDLPALARMRKGLRERVAGSALCDAVGFARRFAGLMREVWQTYCARG